MPDSGSSQSRSPGTCAKQPPGGRRYRLGVGQVAGVVVGGRGVDAAPRGNQAQGVEKLVDVLDLGGELLAVRLQAVAPVQAVLLHHRPAARVVDHDRIVAVELEGNQIGVGHPPGAAAVAGVEMDRPAAALLGRNEHVAAVLLQDAQRGPMDVAEHRVGHATDEERHPGPLSPHRRQEPRKPRAQPQLGRQERAIRPSRPGISPSSPSRSISGSTFRCASRTSTNSRRIRSA